MGQCASLGGKGGSGNIDRLLQEESTSSRNAAGQGPASPGRKRPSKNRRQRTKLLLLGTGNSGKSTVFKQFQLFCGGGFSDAERTYYKTLMVESTLATIKKMLQNANDLLFEGEMKDGEFDDKLVKMLKQQQESEAESAGGDSEVVSFVDFISTNSEEHHTGGGTGTGKDRGKGKGKGKARYQRASDLSDVSFTVEKKPTDEGRADGSGSSKSTATSTSASPSSTSAAGSSRGGSGSGSGSGSNKKKKKKKEQDQSLRREHRFGGSTVISEDVSHLADIVKELPEHTQLYEKFSVTIRKQGPNGEELQEETDIRVAEMLRLIWEDPVIQKVYAMEGQIPTLEAPIAYYMENLDRLAAKDFRPTQDDMLYARKQTRKVQQLEFTAEGKDFLLIDLGGQRIERRNWINYFEDVDAIIYIVGLDGYSQLCLEDGETNRMRESLEVFRDLSQSPFFQQTNIILFFNKEDLFREKIKSIPLNHCFRSYLGDQHDFQKTLEYIAKRFVEAHSRIVQQNIDIDVLMAKVYPYATRATSTDFMKDILSTCQAIFLRKGMAQCGIAAM